MKGFGAFVFGMVIVLLLRSTALAPFAARGIVLDVLAFATVFWALRHDAAWGATFGFVLGLAADLDATHWLGRHALALSVVGYAIGYLARTLVRESARTQLALIVIAVTVHQAWSVTFELGGIQGVLSGWPYLLQRVCVSAVATAAVGTLLLGIVRRVLGRPVFENALVSSG